MKRLISAIVLLVLCGSADAQQIYKCPDGKGGNTYQQVACAPGTKQESVRSYRPVADAPRDYSTPSQRAPNPDFRRADISQRQPAPEQQQAADGPTGYVRCVKPDGSYQMRKGNRCPVRTEFLPQQAGMVQDVATGREHFMVPGGGNGMIDPRTGQRHELISPRPSRQVRDTAQPVSRNEACAEAKAKLSSAQSNPDRTINTLRAAESKYAAMCGG